MIVRKSLETLKMLINKTLVETRKMELVEEIKLLGIVITSHLKWKSNTNKLAAKAYKQIWMLRNLKRFGANKGHLVEVYIQQVRSIVEQDFPVWNPGLNQHECQTLERVQRTAVAILRGEVHTSYREALNNLNLETLKIRREKLCLKFAKKANKHPKFKNWFCLNKNSIKTRSPKLPLKEIKTRTKRYRKSPLPYMTNMLNKHLQKIK